MASAEPSLEPATIRTGYCTGVIGRAVEMHARFYARTVGFGRFFEGKVAAEFAEFATRLSHPSNQLWSVHRSGIILGTIAIDGEDLGQGIAHLRWFIMDDTMRGTGIGRRLLSEAVSWCDAQGFSEIHLWTFRGLDAARRLYEGHGFILAEERLGQQWGSEVLEQKMIRRAPLANTRPE